MLWVEREIQIDKCIYSVNYFARIFFFYFDSDLSYIVQGFSQTNNFFKIIKDYKKTIDFWLISNLCLQTIDWWERKKFLTLSNE